MSGVANLLAALMGGSGFVNLTAGGSIDDSTAAPDTAQAGVTFEADGDIASFTSAAGSVDVGDWITPKAVAPGAYEIMAHQNSGDAVSGTLDTWLSFPQSWFTPEQLVAGSKAANLTISIRRYGVVLSSGTWILAAVVI